MIVGEGLAQVHAQNQVMAANQ
uniref:Uncharacterized protein n=1 Tax=Rhizophora mucronata TaxID=61149 RepID=A0A2P2Q1F1_RHIMU